MSSSMGKVFVVTTFGESHGPGIGAVIDGCPSRMELVPGDIQAALNRRRPGQSSLSSPRQEKDEVHILSGVENGVTLGTPVALWVENHDARTKDYAALANVPRPSHADLTYRRKYGILSGGGGGRASARETVARVAAGAVAEKLLLIRYGIEIVAWVSAVGDIEAPDMRELALKRSDVDRTEVRCPDSASAEKMTEAIHAAAQSGDSLGGVVTCVCRGIPAGLGEPVFDKMGALLGHAMLSIPAVKGFDLGSGFAGARMRGSEHNDLFVFRDNQMRTATNRSGGVQGGITNGEPILFRVAFKPTATIRIPQKTVDYEGRPVNLTIAEGRHDPCVLPRAVPVVEAMAALVLADQALLAGLSGSA